MPDLEPLPDAVPLPPTLAALETRIRLLESQCHVILILSSANAFMNVATIIVAVLAVVS